MDLVIFSANCFYNSSVESDHTRWGECKSELDQFINRTEYAETDLNTYCDPVQQSWQITCKDESNQTNDLRTFGKSFGKGETAKFITLHSQISQRLRRIRQKHRITFTILAWRSRNIKPWQVSINSFLQMKDTFYPAHGRRCYRPSTQDTWQEDCNLKTSLDYIAKPCLNILVTVIVIIIVSPSKLCCR